MTASLSATSRRSFVPAFSPINRKGEHMWAAAGVSAILIAAGVWAGHGFPVPSVSIISEAQATSTQPESVLDHARLGLTIR